MVENDYLDDYQDLSTLIPLSQGYQAFIAATAGLRKTGCSSAKADFEVLIASEDIRVKVEAARCSMEVGRPMREYPKCRLAPEEGSLKGLETFRKELAHDDVEAREVFLESLSRRPLAGAFAYVVPLLVDSRRSLRSLAADYFKIGATCDEDALSALFPFFEYHESAVTELAEAEGLSVRRWAVQSLYFNHGSRRVQDALLAAFDRPGLGIKKQLTNAFRYCPEPAELKQAMLTRIDATDPENSLSACYVLGILADPELRPTFHEAMMGEDVERAYAGTLGLLRILTEVDAPVLQQVRERWRPEGWPG